MEITIKNLKTSYIEKGSGEFIFILHGWGSKKEVHHNMIELMSKKYRVIALDLPGFGESSEPTTPWQVSDYVDFVEEFIEHFKPKIVNLLGHSYGGRIIIKMASKDNLPFKLNKLILVDSAGIKPKRTMSYYYKVYTYKIGKKFLSTNLLMKNFPELYEHYISKAGSSDYKQASSIMKKTMSLSVNEDLTKHLKKIKEETLLIWGENDTATPLSDGKLMKKEIKNSGLVSIKNAGHYSFIDQQMTFNSTISKFLDIDV